MSAMTAESPRVAAARQAMHAAISTIEIAYRDAIAAFTLIDTLDDRQAAFELANGLATTLEKLDEQAVALRKRCIRRIWETENLSLAKLADRVSVSKTRADQLVRAFKTTSATEPATEETP